MLYHAYIDDSADRNRERLIIAGAIIGRREDWNALSRKWKARLDQDQLQYFKSSHCETLNGQFHKFRQFGVEEGRRKAAKVRDDLDSITMESPVTALGVTLSVPFFNAMKNDQPKFGKIPDVPYRLAFQQVLAECAKAMLLLGRNHIVTFGHDDGDDFYVLHNLYREFKKLNPRYSRVMADFVPLDDKLHPPIQAADVAAFVSFKYVDGGLENGPQENMNRIRKRFYKVVNWLERPDPMQPSFTAEADPAKAVYAL
jgi:hypothetical protein